MSSERKILDGVMTLGICYFKDWCCSVKVAFEGGLDCCMFHNYKSLSASRSVPV